MGLTISYMEGKAYAAYLTLEHPFGEKSCHQREIEPEIIVDFGRDGKPLGIEMLDPRRVTWTKLNRVLKKLEQPPLTKEWVRPLRAA